MAFNLQTALTCIPFILNAYAIRSGPNPTGFPLTNRGYRIVHVLYGNDPYDGVLDYVIFGFIAISNPDSDNSYDLMVALRGTKVWDELFTNVKGETAPCPFGTDDLRTHSAFTSLYHSLVIGDESAIQAIQTLVDNNKIKSITICGHSLGAAAATLLAGDLADKGVANPTLYTFGSPRVGSASFAAYFNQLVPDSWRIANLKDGITTLPLPTAIPQTIPDFEHVNNHFPVDSTNQARSTVLCNHSMYTYWHLLDSTHPIDIECQPPSSVLLSMSRLAI